MHPSRVIRGRSSRLLDGRRIVIGITGSIAAVEVPRIIRELLRHGADVRAVMSADAARIITPEAIRFATGNAPVLELTGEVEHVSAFGPGPDRADLFLIAPATANTVAKIAHGIDDTPVTSFASMAIGGGIPVLLAPAWHAQLGRNPAIVESLTRLRGWGIEVLGTQSSENEEKLATPEGVAAAVLHRLARGGWKGRRVLVIGGASREPIDEVRSLTNESSGATAVALATELYFRGADVTFWLGGAHVPVPPFLTTERWSRVSELIERVRQIPKTVPGLDAVWVPAALADFTITPTPGKIDSRSHPKGFTLELRRAPKMLPVLRTSVPAPVPIVGFKLAAEADDSKLRASAERLREETHVDWVVANGPSALGGDSTRVLVLGPAGQSFSAEGPKRDVAARLVDVVGGSLAPIRDPTSPRRGRRPSAR
ncbi:MAG: bifunctional phosphopantothenoylcysteine decarboxylase/phosphopantothenate--cysteine ligase CoaBC [Thermoplasmata archaeon]|nr:bifunctional phosphopantothenoylcysteine decarboxylase/phosphopantothenate--cysteine ligase CoaBC [Thermoplasmata archaeon]